MSINKFHNKLSTVEQFRVTEKHADVTGAANVRVPVCKFVEQLMNSKQRTTTHVTQDDERLREV